MVRMWGLAALLAGALACAACSDGNGSGQETPSATTTAPATSTAVTATPEPGAVPATGVPVVDRFIAAMLSGDVPALQALVDYGQIGCVVQPQGIGSPPVCEAGQPEGTPVKVIGFSTCEGGFMTEADVARALDDWARKDGPHFFSAARMPEGGYAVTFTFERWADGGPRPDSMNGAMFLLSNKGLTHEISGCGWTARTIAAAYPDYLIAPPPPPPVPAGTRHTGTPAIDAVIDALVQQDTPKLASLVVFAQVGCGTERWLPRCPIGTPGGTLVGSITVRGCEPFWLGPYASGQAVPSPGGVSAGGVAEFVDGEIRPAPLPVAIANEPGTDSAGVRYWLIYDVSAATGGPDGGRAFGLDAAGKIAVFDRGCNETAAQFSARFTDFLLSPK